MRGSPTTYFWAGWLLIAAVLAPSLVAGASVMPLPLGVTTRLDYDFEAVVYSITLPRRSQEVSLFMESVAGVTATQVVPIQWYIESPAISPRPRRSSATVTTAGGQNFALTGCSAFANETLIVRFLPADHTSTRTRFQVTATTIDHLTADDQGISTTITIGTPVDLTIKHAGTALLLALPLASEVGNRALMIRLHSTERAINATVELVIGGLPSLRDATTGAFTCTPWIPQTLVLDGNAPVPPTYYLHPCVVTRWVEHARLMPLRLATYADGVEVNATLELSWEEPVALIAGMTQSHVAAIGRLDRAAYSFVAPAGVEEASLAITGLRGMSVAVRVIREPHGDNPCHSESSRWMTCEPSRDCRMSLFTCDTILDTTGGIGNQIPAKTGPPLTDPSGEWLIIVETPHADPSIVPDAARMPRRYPGGYNITLTTGTTPQPTALTLDRPIVGAEVSRGSEAHFTITLNETVLSSPYARLVVDVWLVSSMGDVTSGKENEALLVALNHNAPAGRCYSRRTTCKDYRCRMTVPECLIGASTWWVSVTNAMQDDHNTALFSQLAPMRFSIHAQLLTPTTLPPNGFHTGQIMPIKGVEEAFVVNAPADGMVIVKVQTLNVAGVNMAVNVGMPTTTLPFSPCTRQLELKQDPTGITIYTNVSSGDQVFIALSEVVVIVSPGPKRNLPLAYNLSVVAVPRTIVTPGAPLPLSPADYTLLYINMNDMEDDEVAMLDIKPRDLKYATRYAAVAGTAAAMAIPPAPPFLHSIATDAAQVWAQRSTEFDGSSVSQVDDECIMTALGCRARLPALNGLGGREYYILLTSGWPLRATLTVPTPIELTVGEAQFATVDKEETRRFVLRLSAAERAGVSALWIEVSSFRLAFGPWTLTVNGVDGCHPGNTLQGGEAQAQAYCGVSLSPCDLDAAEGVVNISVRTALGVPFKFRLTTTLETPRALVLSNLTGAAYAKDAIRPTWDSVRGARYAQKHVYSFQAPASMPPGSQLVIKIGDIGANTIPPVDDAENVLRPLYRSDDGQDVNYDYSPTRPSTNVAADLSPIRPDANAFGSTGGAQPDDSEDFEVQSSGTPGGTGVASTSLPPYTGSGNDVYTGGEGSNYASSTADENVGGGGQYHGSVEHSVIVDFHDPMSRDATLVLTAVNDVDAPGAWPGNNNPSFLGADRCGTTLPEWATVTCGATGGTCQLRIPAAQVQLGATYLVGVQAHSYYASDIIYSLAVETVDAAPPAPVALSFGVPQTLEMQAGVHYDVFLETSALPADAFRVNVTCPWSACVIFSLMGGVDERARGSLHDYIVSTRAVGFNAFHCGAHPRLWLQIFSDVAQTATIIVTSGITDLVDGVTQTHAVDLLDLPTWFDAIGDYYTSRGHDWVGEAPRTAADVVVARLSGEAGWVTVTAAAAGMRYLFSETPRWFNQRGCPLDFVYDFDSGAGDGFYLPAVNPTQLYVPTGSRYLALEPLIHTGAGEIDLTFHAQPDLIVTDLNTFTLALPKGSAPRRVIFTPPPGMMPTSGIIPGARLQLVASDPFPGSNLDFQIVPDEGIVPLGFINGGSIDGPIIDIRSARTDQPDIGPLRVLRPNDRLVVDFQCRYGGPWVPDCVQNLTGQFFGTHAHTLSAANPTVGIYEYQEVDNYDRVNVLSLSSDFADSYDLIRISSTLAAGSQRSILNANLEALVTTVQDVNVYLTPADLAGQTTLYLTTARTSYEFNPDMGGGPEPYQYNVSYLTVSNANTVINPGHFEEHHVTPAPGETTVLLRWPARPDDDVNAGICKIWAATLATDNPTLSAAWHHSSGRVSNDIDILPTTRVMAVDDCTAQRNGEHLVWAYVSDGGPVTVVVHTQESLELYENVPLDVAARWENVISGGAFVHLNRDRSSTAIREELVITGAWVNATLKVIGDSESASLSQHYCRDLYCVYIVQVKSYWDDMLILFDRGTPFNVTYRALRPGPMPLSRSGSAKKGPVTVTAYGSYYASMVLPSDASLGGVVTATLTATTGILQGGFAVMTEPYITPVDPGWPFFASTTAYGMCTSLFSHCLAVANEKNITCTYTLQQPVARDRAMVFGVTSQDDDEATFTVEFTYEGYEIINVSLMEPVIFNLTNSDINEPHYLLIDIPQFTEIPELVLTWDGNYNTFYVSGEMFFNGVPDCANIMKAQRYFGTTLESTNQNQLFPRTFVTVYGRGTFRASLSNYMPLAPNNAYPLSKLASTFYPRVPVYSLANNQSITRTLQLGEAATYRVSSLSDGFVLLDINMPYAFQSLLATTASSSGPQTHVVEYTDGDVYASFLCNDWHDGAGAPQPCTFTVSATQHVHGVASSAVTLLSRGQVGRGTVGALQKHRIEVDSTGLAAGDLLEVHMTVWSDAGFPGVPNAFSNSEREAFAAACSSDASSKTSICTFAFMDFTGPVGVEIIGDEDAPCEFRAYATSTANSDIPVLTRDAPVSVSDAPAGERVDHNFWRAGTPWIVKPRLGPTDYLHTFSSYSYDISSGEGIQPMSSPDSTMLRFQFTVPSSDSAPWDNVVLRADARHDVCIYVALERMPMAMDTVFDADYFQCQNDARMLTLPCVPPGTYYGLVVAKRGEDFDADIGHNYGVSITLTYDLPEVVDLTLDTPHSGRINMTALNTGFRDMDSYSKSKIFRVAATGAPLQVTVTGERIVLIPSGDLLARVEVSNTYNHKAFAPRACLMAGAVTPPIVPFTQSTANVQRVTLTTAGVPGVEYEYYYIRVLSLAKDIDVKLPETDFTITVTRFDKKVLNVVQLGVPATIPLCLPGGNPLQTACPVGPIIKMDVPEALVGSRVHVYADAILEPFTWADFFGNYHIASPVYDLACGTTHTMPLRWDNTWRASKAINVTVELVAPLRFNASVSAQFRLPQLGIQDIIIGSAAAVTYRVTQLNSDLLFKIGEYFGDPCAPNTRVQRFNVGQSVPQAFALPPRVGGRHLYVGYSDFVPSTAEQARWDWQPTIAPRNYSIDVRIGTDNCAPRGEPDVCPGAPGSVYVGFDTVTHGAAQAHAVYADFRAQTSFFPLPDACLAQVQRYFCILYMPSCSELGAPLQACASVCADVRSACGDMAMAAMNVSLNSCAAPGATDCFAADPSPPDAVVASPPPASPPAESSSNVGLIVGLAVGLSAAVALAVGGAVLWWRRSRARGRGDRGDADARQKVASGDASSGSDDSK